MEKIVYEAKPFICFAVGIGSMVFAENNYGKVAALVLIACGITIFYYRHRFRSKK